MTRNLSGALDDEGFANTVGGGTSERAEFQYCKYCGCKIPPSSTVCPYCGRDQLTTRPKVDVGGKKGFRSYVAKNMRTIRVATFILCMSIFVATLLAGSQTPLSLDEAQLIVDEVEKTIMSDLTALRIAQNNIAICLFFFIPVFGALFMAFVSYSTGIIFSAYAILSTSTTRSEILLSAFLIPSTWFEISAYSLAASEGILLLLGILTRRFKEEGKTLLKTVLISVALLLVGAVIESAVILAGS